MPFEKGKGQVVRKELSLRRKGLERKLLTTNADKGIFQQANNKTGAYLGSIQRP